MRSCNEAELDYNIIISRKRSGVPTSCKSDITGEKTQFNKGEKR